MSLELDNQRPEVKSEIGALRAEWAGFLQKLGSDSVPPAELFHYTKAEGLFGIVSKNCLWASNVRFLNDASELEYGIELTREVALTSSGAHGANSSDLLELTLDLERLWCVYAFSLSEEGDQLSQWRAYASGGAGYCIGLDSKGIRALKYQATESPLLLKICYNRKCQEDTIQNLIKLYCASVDRVNNITKEEMALFAGTFSGHLQSILVSFKHSAFKEEREWRLVCPVNRLVGYKESYMINFGVLSNTLVPLYHLEPASPGLLPIRSVKLGAGVKLGASVLTGVNHKLPKPRPDTPAESAVRLLMCNHEHKDFAVGLSTIPLRCLA